MPPESDAFWNLFEDFPVAKDTKEKLNDALAEHVVEPLANAGHPDLGAALATVPAYTRRLAPARPKDTRHGYAPDYPTEALGRPAAPHAAHEAGVGLAPAVSDRPRSPRPLRPRPRR